MSNRFLCLDQSPHDKIERRFSYKVMGKWKDPSPFTYSDGSVRSPTIIPSIYGRYDCLRFSYVKWEIFTSQTRPDRKKMSRVSTGDRSLTPSLRSRYRTF